MPQNSEAMFQSIPLDEAYKKTMEYDKLILNFKVQGAVLDGDKKLDKSYTKSVRKAIEYQMQFSRSELCALLIRSYKESEQTE